MIMNEDQQMPRADIGSTTVFNKPPMPESVIKWRMDTKDVLDEIMPLMTELGNDSFDKHVMMLMKGIINKINIQGNIDDDTLRVLTLGIADDETEHIGLNYERYEMSPENRESYIDMIISTMMLGLSRAKDDWERKHTVDQGQERVTTTQGFQSIFPFQGGGQVQRPLNRWPL